MARALIVGCGCRGRALGSALLAEGWAVRGTAREEAGLEAIEGAGIEAVVADPDRAATILDHIADVTVVHWLMGSALGEPEVIAAIHGPRLERVLEKLVDTPVRGFVYEGAGRVQDHWLEGGAKLVAEASERWRIPAEVVTADQGDHREWLEQMLTATNRLISA
jgi:Trk K+ transport system NAD-binding subunit